MILERVFFIVAALVGLSSVEKVLGKNNVEPPPCKDDPFFEYGTFQWNGNTYTRICAWLTENPSLIKTRKKDWCDVKLNIYGIDYVIHEKCPEACDKCPPPPPKPCVNSPIYWHDSTGEEYTCDWYAGGESCTIWGNSFPMYGKTANQACCACGGGCENAPADFRDSCGKDCDWYAATASRCKSHGHRFRNNGYVANEACCVCKGGKK